MAGKKAEDLFIDDGEFNKAALRGAFEKWIDRDWTYGPGCESSIVCKDMESFRGKAFKSFDNWINRQVEDDWFKDVKFEYGKRVPREVFYEYLESNEEFRKKVLSHIEGTDEWYERRGEEPEWDDDESGGDDSKSTEDDQKSFGESRFPELNEIGVIDDDGRIVQSKLRGLVMAFVKDVDEIRGSDRAFDVKWSQRAFLYWGSDKFDGEWIKMATKAHENGAIYDAVSWVYDNKPEMATKMEKKFRGNFDLEAGNPDTDDVLEAFLDAEVPGWNEDDDDEETNQSKSKWEEFEEQAEELETTAKETREDEGDRETESKWEQFEQESKETDNDNARNQEQEATGESGTGPATTDNGTSNSGGNPDNLGDWAEQEGTTDSVHKRSRTRTNGQSEVTETTRQSRTKDVSKRETTTVEADVECEDFGRPHEIQWPDVEPIDEFERNRIYEGNTFEWALKLPQNSVDTIVTSPPYYALRDYDIDDAFPISGDFTCEHNWENEFCTECGAFLGQLGHEPDPATFIDHIVDLMDRYKRVLKPTGSLWLNIGDTYAGNDMDGRVKANRKSRMMIPERVYRRMVQTGWHLRDYVIWVKKIWMPDDDLKGNGKPFAGSSRLADQWEPMVRFTPQADHYSDVDSNRLLPPSFDGDLGSKGIEGKFRKGEDTQRGKTYNELGTNPPDVWLINSDGYDGDHRAVFPEELPKRCINITTPDRVCEKCGKPYEKEVHVEEGNKLSPGGDYATYEQTCHCDVGHQPGVAFDPFLGSGTTAVAAANNGYDWAGVELSEKYQELARKRIPTGRQVGLNQW